MKTPLAALVWLCAPAAAAAQDWPQFRGPDGQGRSGVARAPLKWSDTSANITWKAPIEGLGWSSPVLLDGRIWLTTATEAGLCLRAVCFDAKTGRELQNVELFRRAQAPHIQSKNSHASPTPILDGDRVYVHFGTHGTACLSREGKVLWRQELRYQDVHGSGGSPVLERDLLIFSCDGSDQQFVVALDRDTGKIRWKAARPENTYFKKFAFSTPLVIDAGGARQVVSPGASGVSGYDAATGRALWHVKYVGGYSTVPRPVFGHGLIFLATGFDTPGFLAIRAGGQGDVTDTHVAWRLGPGAPLTPSALLVGEELYLVSDQGIATCLEARTGKVHWQERLGGTFSASPLLAAGRIYLQDEKGGTTVLKPGKVYSLLQKNQVKGRTFASPAPIEGAFFLRTDTHLLRIEAE